MDTQAVNAAQTSTVASSTSNAASALSGEDFFKLLIAELTNQDPLEPTSNQDLLNQISSIRDIELSTSLSESLTSLTEQQRFASAGSLIGQFVTASDSGDGTGLRPVWFRRCGSILPALHFWSCRMEPHLLLTRWNPFSRRKEPEMLW